MTTGAEVPDGRSVHLLEPRLPALTELGPGLLSVPAGRRRAELALPAALAGAALGLDCLRLWLPSAVATALFFPRFGVAFHDLLHRSLGLSARANRAWLTVTGLLAIQSGHAVQAAHLEHHRRFPGEDDPEAYIGRLPVWRALAHGPTYQYRMWRWALEHRPELRRVVLLEAAAHTAAVLASVALLPWTPGPVFFCAMVLAGDSIFPALSENLLHDQRAATPHARTRTIRGRLFEAYFLGLGYHLEHHAYPAVPTANNRELARRLEPALEAIGARPLTLI